MEFGLIALTAVLLFFLGFANGANDVSKAIATLAGAGLTSVRGAVLWGTVWTVAGALAGLFWGGALIKNITENIYTTQHDFYLPLTVAVSAAPIGWVALATWRRWPVSTTHAIVGGLVGAGLTAYGMQGIYWSAILSKIALPLLASPFMAIALAWLFTPLLQRVAGAIGRTRLCLTPVPKVALLARNDNGRTGQIPLEDCLVCHCDSPQAGLTHGLAISVDHMHWLTSGLLSFSRGLNDAPKLIAVVLPFLMLDEYVAPVWLFFWAALAMGAGSWLAGNNITEVLGFKVTKMNHEQGFAANLVAAVLVIGASRVGLPVSTTHVSASSIMGVGLAHRRGLNMKTVSGMLFAWLVTAPVSGLFAAVIYMGGAL
ncbi:MAG: inorganic phosphate transporter [Gammaproteobacteria bacterium]